MLRFGLIGAGSMGQIHLRWAERHPDLTIAAICDLDQDRAQLTARLHGAAAYADYHRMLATERLDCIAIAAPHNQLAQIALACISARCHVLVEKPLARHVAEARAMIEAAHAQGVRLGCIYQYRSFATPRTIKAILDSGAIGSVRQIIWNWHELRSQAYYERLSWRADWCGAGSGLLMNQLSHDIDLLRYLVGEVASVQAALVNHVHDTPLEDALAAQLRLANGALVSLSASINHSAHGNYRAILGTAGVITLPAAQALAGNPNDVIRLGIYEHSVEQAVRGYTDDHRQSAIGWQDIRTRPPAKNRWLPGFARPAARAMADRIAPQRGQWREGQIPHDGHGLALWQFIESILMDRPLPDDIDAANALRTLEVLNALIMAGIEQRCVELPVDADAYSALFARLAAGEIDLRKA